jgi:hypothetical protein
MAENLSITNPNVDLETNKSDLAASAAKFLGPFIGALTAAGLFGPSAPVVGALLGNAISLVIPNKKIDRVIIFLKTLEDRLSYLEEDVVKERVKTEEFLDLLEDGVIQSSRALTPERRAYIANLLSTSLTDETLDHLAQKKLLSILNELNDAEIILLHFYALRHAGDPKAEQMLSDYAFIRSALRAFDKDEPDEKEFMFRQYRHGVYMASLTMGPLEEEYPSDLGYLLLKYVQPGNTSVPIET